ncbi:zinc finger protein 473 homolog [Cheilinus undulatus]|uniref:zinc finger protein 473 homolog n=1 Tax=Cheilinus undulatus TaxID=241271 RepID=UPI001BD20EEA|nr:zinc finger protein 473 homolog [Cheilinus undulatus]
MSFPSSFGTQVAAIMDVLAKAAVAEITKLAEDGAVVLRLEMCRRDSEIQELKRSLKAMEVELCKAQEAAKTRPTEDKQAQTESIAPAKDEKEGQERFALYQELSTTESSCEPQRGAKESREMRPEVKPEPEPAPQEITENAASVNICFEREELIWPPPACSIFENNSVATQEFSTHIESYAAQRNTSNAEGVADKSLSVHIKEEIENTTNHNNAAVDMGFERHEPIWPPPACSMFEKSSVAMQEQTQHFSSPLSEQYAAHRRTKNAEEIRDGSLSALIKEELETQPMCIGRTTSELEQLRHALHPSVRQEQNLQSFPQQAGPSLAPPHAQRLAASRIGPNIDDNILGRNSPRAKRLQNVWRVNQKVYTCPVCRRTFPRLSQLEEHKATHQPFKGFRCLECGKSFTQKRRLRTHQSVHTGERPFSCKICGKRFSRQDNCLRHERFHSGTKPHTCGQCGKSFTVLINLKKHQELHLLGR